MKKWKKILFGFLIIILAAAGYGLYLYKKKPADVRTLAAKYELSAALLAADFNADETAANKKYLDKVISVKGSVSDIMVDSSNQATVFLDSGDPLVAVTCSFYDDEATTARSIPKGTVVTIKGMCTGKLTDVVLNKCSVCK